MWTLSSRPFAINKVVETGLQVIVLRNYENGCYPGLGIQPFADKVVRNFSLPDNWTMGEASESLNQAYNPQHYADIYFLIDAEGHIRDISGAPSATMDRIISFATNQQ